jgi:hypothetical protein
MAWGRAVAKAARDVAGWPATEGVVEASVVERREKSMRRSNVEFEVQVCYAFRVGGRTYRCTRVAIGRTECFETEREARRRATAWRAGQTVRVMYDPARPDHAVLEYTPVSQGWRAFALGVVVLAIGAAVGLHETLGLLSD